jgi:hypothetical protein
VSTGAIIGLSVAVLVLLALVVLVTTARRNDARRGEGALSRETIDRDRAARKAAEPALVGAPAPVATGREVEQEARRASTELVRRPPSRQRRTSRPTRRSSASPAGSSSTAAPHC